MAYQRYQPGEYRPQFGGFSFFPPVIKNLIIINVAMFILQNLFIGGTFSFNGAPIGYWFAETFYLNPLGYGFKVWQLVSYMFLHGGIGHIFLNMLMLWMFGMEVENEWGSKKFLVFYLACGLAAGLANLFIAPMFSDPAATIGASGGVYGVLVAFAMMFPNRLVFIYFLFPVRAKYLITFFIGLEVFNGVTGTSDGIAHIAHLGGALLAAIWVLLDNRGVIDRWLASRSRTPGIGRSGSQPTGWGGAPREATFHDINEARPTAPTRTPTGDATFDRHQQTIDEILDKISRSGYAGLTEEEKRILLDASRRIHPDKDA